MVKKRIPEEPKGRAEKALRSWRMFLQHMSKLTVPQLEQVLDYELATKRRKMIIVRTQMRLRKLKGIKERNRMDKKL